MDSLKKGTYGRLKLPAANSKKIPDMPNNENEKNAIIELKKLYLETIKLDVDLQKEIYNLEKSFEKKHNEIFDKRNKILQDFKKKTHGDANTQSNISHFWLSVLKSSYTEFISKKDEKILQHLVDIRSELVNEPEVMFIIEFFFEPNEYFTNKVLTKTYFLNCLPDMDDPISYDGAEIYKCEGCHIDWKRPETENEKNNLSGFSSFFDFFNPPALPENPRDPSYGDINAILQNDFELGFYLKERVIPKAVLFFTGEIADCESSEGGTDASGDECEDDDEDEEALTDGIDEDEN